MGILDFIFPKRCIGCRKFGEYICADCFTQISFDVEKTCLVCNRLAIDGVTHPACRGKYVIDGSLASIAYKRLAKRLIYAFKYRPYLSDLEKTLSDFFYEGLIQEEQFHKILKHKSVIVPIPLFPKKLRERGYNQADMLAKNLAKRFGIRVIPLLNRVRLTPSQTSLKRDDRRENIKGAFETSNSFKAPKLQRSQESKSSETLQLCSFEAVEQVILVDDVITSGATMLEAANVLKRSGIKKVWGIALAHGK